MRREKREVEKVQRQITRRVGTRGEVQGVKVRGRLKDTREG